ncbi:T3SS effector HopA1 family protein [Nonomuraea sp. MCN248]|uniref:T3SS effector HopA1 family protein n=1 Tax=Nonomuraea corallina TaxID=2989783 RepID=A0ABT4SM09_9ACTN|nr:T3SS effector HopA1 family protein [Nonomuraea corallina]MDA0638267.1 T3SS effector HopA1 family protein [Nonomuraea corallina]
MRQHLGRVRVAADLTSATVDGREVTASGPKALRKALADALYEALHTGATPKEDLPRRPPSDPAFEQVLRATVPHSGTRVLAPVEPGAPHVVRLGGVRVLVPEPETAVGGETGQRPDAAVTGEAGKTRWVTLPSVMPALSPGFLLVNGSAGHGLDEGACVRVYAGAERPDAAPGLWGAVLARLEDLGLPYRAKVLSIRGHYPRRDSIVVYLGPRSWHAVPEIARAATAAGGLRPDLSAYVAPLGPGLGWAWEPHDPRPGMRGLSFGEHRSHAVAAGLLAHAEHGGDLEQAVDEELRAAGITPDAPYRNLASPPLPFETSGPATGPGSHKIQERG